MKKWKMSERKHNLDYCLNFEFHPTLDEMIFYLITNKRDISMMLAWHSFSRKRCIFNEDNIQKLDEFSVVEKYHAFWM
jgi:hypothetical protein